MVFSPGNSPGSITFSNAFTLAPQATLLIEMAGYPPGAGYDQILASTATVSSANLDRATLGGFTPSTGSQFVILDNFGPQAIGGIFAGAPEGSTNDFGSGILFAITYAGNGPSGGNNDIVLTAVPEPTTWLLTAFGLCCWPLLRRRTIKYQK